MSLSLDQGTTPKGTLVKTWGVAQENGKRVISIGPEIEITHDDFCQVIEYFLTNEDLYENDPRLELFERLKKAEIGKGHGSHFAQFSPGGNRTEIKIDGKGIVFPSRPPKKK